MCGRFALSIGVAQLAEEFSTHSTSERELPFSWNIKPTEEIYIVKDQGIEIAHWGMIAPWSKNLLEALRSQPRAINARSESIHEKPTFRESFRGRRCLVPATGYYEWVTELGPYKTKQPIYISRVDKKPIAFSGIYNRWISPEGEIKDCVSIITREAIGPLAGLHHRMPLLLSPESWGEWLSSELTQVDQIRKVMKAEVPVTELQFWPVSDLVNSIGSSGAELTAKIDVGEPETLF
jgi:putative SOS response-associated peptidase YedK